MTCPHYRFKENDYYCALLGKYVKTDCYYKYCRNYDYRDCPDFEEESGGCYLTSACMYSRGLPDDCYELETLREFRDTWLKSTEQGKEEIEQYYVIAPKIVSSINKSKDSKSVYEKLYVEMVLPCVKLIEDNKYQEALELYRSTTMKLKEEYY